VPTPPNPGPPNPQVPNPQVPQWQSPPPITPLDAEASAERLRQRLRLFLIMLLGLMVVSQLALPFRLGGIVLALGTAWVGVQLLILMTARYRAGLGGRGWVVVSVGLALTAVLLLMLVAEAAYYPLVSDLENCRAGANTETAKNACDQDTKDRLDNLVNRLNHTSP
jgi:hypothetical protein